MGGLFEGIGRVSGITYKELNKMPDVDIYALDDEITKNYGEQLKSEGVSEENVNNYIEQSKAGQTSVESVKDHIVAVEKEMGKADLSKNQNAAIPAKVNLQTNTKPVDTENILSNIQTDQKAVSNGNLNIDQNSNVNQDKTVDQLSDLKVDLTDNDIQKMLADKKVFSNQQLDNMDDRQLFHVLRTKSFDYEYKIPNIYDRVIKLKNVSDIKGMKNLVKELQGSGENYSLNPLNRNDTISPKVDDSYNVNLIAGNQIKDIKGGVNTQGIKSWNQISDILRKEGLDERKTNEILNIQKGNRPDPSTYLSKEYINKHLSMFRNGVTKIKSKAPIDTEGVGIGTFVIPKSVADDVISKANGDVSKLEELLV